MRDDVVIGEGVQSPSSVNRTGLISPSGEKNWIRESTTTYEVTELYLDMGIIIFKDTVEGQNLKSIISFSDGSPGQIHDWLVKLLLKTVAERDPELLMRRIRQALEESYLAGKEAKAGQIRESLGI